MGRFGQSSMEHTQRMRDLLSPGQWSADLFELTEQGVEVRGWALAPDGDPARVGLTINGREFDSVEYPLLRPDLGDVFWYLPDAASSGYVARARLTPAEAFAAGHATLEFIDRKTGRLVAEDNAYYFPDVAADSLPFPDAARRKRVQGNDDVSSFRKIGYTLYVKLEQALIKLLGKGYGDWPRILDWGCGCGRMTRYFRNRPGQTITGIDIDADNIAFCERALPFGRFRTVGLHPPTSLPAGSFDLMIGISVFTHLKEAQQFEWLGELRRIAAPGAVLLMTVHGDNAVCRARWDPDMLERWQTTGFDDSGINRDLEGVVQAGYYGNSHHTQSYIRQNWSRYFEIVDVLPGYISNFQDLVVMRKRK
jgi:SAM-dependent methyltransferase